MRHEVEELLCGRAMRVDEGDAFAVLDILDRHVLEHGGLAHAGLPDHVHVLAAIDRAYAEHLALSARVRCRKIRDAALVIACIGMHAP